MKLTCHLPASTYLLGVWRAKHPVQVRNDQNAGCASKRLWRAFQAGNWAQKAGFKLWQCWPCHCNCPRNDIRDEKWHYKTQTTRPAGNSRLKQPTMSRPTEGQRTSKCLATIPKGPQWRTYLAFGDSLDLAKFLIGFFSAGFYMLYTLQTLHIFMIFMHDSCGSFRSFTNIVLSLWYSDHSWASSWTRGGHSVLSWGHSPTAEELKVSRLTGKCQDAVRQKLLSKMRNIPGKSVTGTGSQLESERGRHPRKTVAIFKRFVQRNSEFNSIFTRPVRYALTNTLHPCPCPCSACRRNASIAIMLIESDWQQMWQSKTTHQDKLQLQVLAGTHWKISRLFEQSPSIRK